MVKCDVKDCNDERDFATEADLNFHMSQVHPKEWKLKQEKINKEAKSHMEKKFGKKYLKIPSQILNPAPEPTS